MPPNNKFHQYRNAFLKWKDIEIVNNKTFAKKINSESQKSKCAIDSTHFDVVQLARLPSWPC